LGKCDKQCWSLVVASGVDAEMVVVGIVGFGVGMLVGVAGCTFYGEVHSFEGVWLLLCQLCQLFGEVVGCGAGEGTIFTPQLVSVGFVLLFECVFDVVVYQWDECDEVGLVD